MQASASHAGLCLHNNLCSGTQSERNAFTQLLVLLSLSLCLAPDDHFTTVYLRASNIEQLQGFASVNRHSRARNSNHCQHKPSAAYKAISTTVLSCLYKPIISFLLVLKQAYVSWKTKKKQITSNLNPLPIFWR